MMVQASTTEIVFEAALRRMFALFVFAAAFAGLLFFPAAVWSQQNSSRFTTVLIGGDLHFGENYFLRADGSEKRPGYADFVNYDRGFAALKPLLERADYALVNLETPLSPPGDGAADDKEYVHWTNPASAIASLKAQGFDAVGLANNHAYDQGGAGLRLTLDNLAGAGITAFGAGLTLDEARRPLRFDIALPDRGRRSLAIFAVFEERKRYREDYEVYAEAGKPGLAPIDIPWLRQEIDRIRAEDPETFIVVYPHWGRNYRWATDGQIETGRAFIDAGADLVVGHHGHALQEIERYKDRWILYGIGNFVFNAPGRYADNLLVPPFSLVVDLRFGPDQNTAPLINLYPIYSDNKATGYQPRLATDEEANQILIELRGRPVASGLPDVRVAQDAGGSLLQLSN